MDISIGLPNTIDVDGATVVAWARRAEERGFRSLATIDRIVYPNYDSLTSLAVAAGATSRIGLFTDILLTPLYPPVWLAKASASLHAMSGGRLTLGLGVGGRADDFAAMEQNMARRGKLMDQALDLLERAWAGESVTGDEFPVVPNAAAGAKVPVLVGGATDIAVQRTSDSATRRRPAHRCTGTTDFSASGRTPSPRARSARPRRPRTRCGPTPAWG
jgi:alkanesulfonate monooxygenase SsuD/methylene tetrahydromethanopterin reductase-like flavin-dependent oxidoreductase (luciferase family)